MEEPRRGHLGFEEETDLAAVETHLGRQWEPWSTS